MTKARTYAAGRDFRIEVQSWLESLGLRMIRMAIMGDGKGAPREQLLLQIPGIGELDIQAKLRTDDDAKTAKVERILGNSDMLFTRRARPGTVADEMLVIMPASTLSLLLRMMKTQRDEILRTMKPEGKQSVGG